MNDPKTPDEYERAHAGHVHDTLVITAEDMKSTDRLRELLARASHRTEDSSEALDRAVHDLEAAMNSRDPDRIAAERLEYEVVSAVADVWLGHQDRLLRLLGHLDMLSSTDTANTYSAAMVTWTKVLGFATAVLAVATLVLIWATLTT